MRYSPTSVSCGRQHFYCTMLGKHINHWLLPSLSRLQHYCPGPGNRGKMVVVLGVTCRRLMSRDKRDCSEGSLLHHVGFCFFFHIAIIYRVRTGQVPTSSLPCSQQQWQGKEELKSRTVNIPPQGRRYGHILYFNFISLAISKINGQENNQLSRQAHLSRLFSNINNCGTTEIEPK